MISPDADDYEKELESTEPDPYFLGPRWLRPPPAHGLETDYKLALSVRHVPTKHYVEPKVLLPYETRPGQIPRRIQVERQKRNFVTVDINAELQKSGVIAHLVSTVKMTKKEPIESMPLSMFYNSDFDSRSMESWTELANQSVLMGRAMFVDEVKENVTVEWRPCNIIAAVDGIFDVQFYNETPSTHGREQKAKPVVLTDAKLGRLFICFDAEDPVVYCEHLLDTMRRKSETAASVALNLYVDCMPMDGLKELNSEQISRIVESAVNTDKLRQNTCLDTSAAVQQFNMNHMRTLNQLILSDLLVMRTDDIKMAKIVSTNANVFHDPSRTFPPICEIKIPCDKTFQERVNEFKFNSLWNKLEPINITLQLYCENYIISNMKFFATTEKTQRLEEFTLSQTFAANNMITAIKENWVNNITNSVRHHLKDVKKGWFNIEESNLEVYQFSKVRKFMVRINFVAEDTLRDLVYKCVNGYSDMIHRFCPHSVKVHSNISVDVVGGRFPLFTVDLKVAEATGDSPAKFVYSASAETLYTAVMSNFDNSFEMLKGIIKIERRVMKKLFWAYDPILQIPQKEEIWATTLRNALSEKLELSLEPLTTYLETLHEFQELIDIDIKMYADEAAVRYGYAKSQGLNLPELCSRARKHATDAELIFNAMPATISLGLVLVDCRQIKKALAAKHKNIAARLFEVLESKTKEYADGVMDEFRGMYDKLCGCPQTIEGVSEMKEYMGTLQMRIDSLSGKISQNDNHYSLMENAEWQISSEQMDTRWEVYRWPNRMASEVSKQEKYMRILEVQYKRKMEEDQDDFAHDLANLRNDVGKLKELTKLSGAVKNAETVRRIKASLQMAEERSKVFNFRESLLNVPESPYNELKETVRVFEPFYDLWDSSERWLSHKENWSNGAFQDLNAEDVETTVTALLKNLAKSAKSFEKNNLSQVNVIASQVRDEVDLFRPKVPLIVALRNPGMKERHWTDLAEKTGCYIPTDRSSLTLESLCKMGLNNSKAMVNVEKVAEKAAKEFGIETSLDKMAKAWNTVTLIIEPFKDTGTCILKGIDDIMNILDEQITITQAMAFSAFKGPFEARITQWNATLQSVSELIDEWTQLQRNWLYLQPIFDSADINKQLPLEGKRFATVDKYWRTTMASAVKKVLAIKFCADQRILERFKEGNKLLELVQKGLADYLETKRAGFSRFYFLSNDELLEILSETKDPLRVQPHLRKCFEGIKSVEFQESLLITGMSSPEQEYVPFCSPVDPKNKNIEFWMGEVKDAMIAAVRHHMLKAILDYSNCARTLWMQRWPAQCVLNASQTLWTREVEEFLKARGNQGARAYYEQLRRQLDDMVILIRGQISKAARITVGSLAVVDVHARDVQKKLADAGVSTVTDFDWISQMRYYWEGDIEGSEGDLSVIMVSSKRAYGNEYLGNTFRLVITPLTDKCYLTLMGALQMILGGAPAGPAGTGKTETTKDLAKALAKQCVVFNCSDGLDYMAMGKFFKGLASSGAWACFDEFNRINIEVLSVIAQQVIQLQGAVQRGEKRTIFEGTDIVVNSDFAVFITMNPGYAGRAELPDNLEALFRPVAMMVPDYGLIGEIMLFSYGYMENRKCAEKMVATFRLCSEQLSAQDHYDYGMRAVKTVITAAGNLKRAAPNESEEALLMRALQDVNVPKFLSHDLPLFAGILSDLFPGIDRPAFDYTPLLSSLKCSIQERNLQPVPIFLLKNIELYEMICVRHGLMVVGPTGGGKSANIQILGTALSRLKDKGLIGDRFEKTKIYHLNPKSIRMSQLYGEFDENTHEWQDGILCVIIRTCIKNDNTDLKWILFDGPVDAIWIENMNTVLDDNKKLCLTSGEIIQLSDPMTMMFEPEDLAVASPATVSRCGMIYMEPNSLGYDVLIQSWLNTVPASISDQASPALSKLFDLYVPSILPYLRRNLIEPLPTVNNCLVKGLLHLLDSFFSDFKERDDGSEKKTTEEIRFFIERIEAVFIFSLIWSLCCTVNAQSRKFMNNFLRSIMDSNNVQFPIPKEGSIYDYKFDVKKGNWILWKKSINAYVYDNKLTYAELIIPTKDSICYTYLLHSLVTNGKHVIMTGPTGTGKSVNISGHLQNKLPERFVPITMSFSAQSSANQTQDLIDNKCEKRRKGIYGPSAGSEFSLFVDDVNMPSKEEFGAQPPIELLRQWFDSGGWYDRKSLEMKKIIDVIFVCACGPPGGGRNHITARFLRHFNIINYVELSNGSLCLIFTTILSNFLSTFDQSVAKLAEGIVNATVSVYNTILEDLRPTPAKPHYTFNMRDISKVFQGLLMGDKRKITTPVQLGRMWINECSAVFSDRLINTTDKDWLRKQLETKMEENTDLKSSSLWVESSVVVCADFMIPGADVRTYEEVNVHDLQTVVEEYLSEYNGDSKQPMHLVIFEDAMLHVVRISRVLRQPAGHALLLGVGGSGRQSLTRLASYINGYELYQIEVTKGYSLNEWRDNVKECLLAAGIQNKPLVFLFNESQIINETMLEDINGILNSGDVPNLYAAEDFEIIASTCKAECIKHKKQPTKLNMFAHYLTRVKNNVHLILCMSPLGTLFRTRLRKFPSLVNCCTIDWFTDWPDEALQSVATKYIASSNIGLHQSSEKHVITFFQFIHQSIEKATIEFLAVMRRPFYVTPTSYLELLATYSSILIEKRREVGTLRDRFKIGVEKLINTEMSVNELQANLTEMEPKLIRTQVDVELMIIQISKDKAAAAETKASVEVEEALASKKAVDTQAIADDAQRDLDEALPALAEAVQCLKDLRKSDIDEVKSLGRPPVNVVRTLTALCVMFDVKPDLVNDPENPGKKMKDYFKAAGKHLLSNGAKLLEDMTNYDKDNISLHIITQIEPFYNDPQFTPEIVEKASKACRAMCMWARAMYKYHQVTLIVEPKKLLLAEAQESLDTTNSLLRKARLTLNNAEKEIAELETSFLQASEKKEQLVFDVEQCRARLGRAQNLMGGLGSEKERWTESCSNLSSSYDNLVGDALVSAGSIAYLGVFTPEYRSKILKSWQDQLLQLGIPHSAGCSLRTTLSDPVAIRNWTLCGLPSDSHSVENGIIMLKGRRYPLLIDPQGQANRYIKMMGKDCTLCSNDIDVIKMSDKNFLRTLENGVRFGRWVLLENIGESLDAALEPLLLQQKFRQGGTVMIKIGDSTIPWNDSFKFYMTTKLPNPHYPPEICVKVSLINFAITFSGLEDQLLGVVVVEEMPAIEDKKNALVILGTRMRKELQEIEDTILAKLSDSTGNILDDYKLISILASSKVKSAEILVKVREAEGTEEVIDKSRNKYRPVAYRGAILYFCTADLGNIDPMYQYSLQWFRALFIQAIRLSPSSENILERIEHLNNFFTYYIYTNICRSLFEKHKLLFSFLLTIRILQGEKVINPAQWLFLISGKAMSAVGLPNPSPDWLDNRMWSEITALTTLPLFANLAQDIVSDVPAWRKIYDSPDPHLIKLPSTYIDLEDTHRSWSVKLTSFQQLCVLRAIRADKIPDGVLHYVVEQLGDRFVQPPPFDLAGCFADSNILSPLIFVLSKGSDPTKAFIEFASKMRMDRRIKMLSLGQGQGLKVIKIIEEATQKGNWVLLQNCHLFISWLPELERITENLSPETVHKDFRLWLTSMPCAEFPVSILQSSVKMTNEPPRGLRANLRSAYFKLNNDDLNVTAKPAEYRKLLFGLSFFHAVVQERRLYGPLGWNIPYEFNDTDLDISRGQLVLFLDQYSDTPWKVLNFLTSYINYGGRVTDYIDLRTIDVIMRCFYTPDLLNVGYKFDKDGVFYSLDPDPENPHKSYLDYIDSLPLQASPVVFGMHDNAQIASANFETFSLFEICSSLQRSGSMGGGNEGAREKLIETVALNINRKIQQKGEFETELIQMIYPVAYEQSMNTVLIQEAVRYNKLISVILETLPQLLKALKGLVVMSSELEAIASSIAVNQVPLAWSAVAYPSLKPCAAWSEDLVERLHFIQDWIDKGVPSVFWISGFYFPQAFLTGSLQNYARKHKFPIDQVNFNFHVVQAEWQELSVTPEDGVYIRGLYMEGARWDSRTKSIADSLPKQLYTDIPVLHLRPERYRKEPKSGVYRCPVYKILSRRGTLSTTGHSTNFILWIELPSNRSDFINDEGKCDQEEWIKAGVAAFSSLMY